MIIFLYKNIFNHFSKSNKFVLLLSKEWLHSYGYFLLCKILSKKCTGIANFDSRGRTRHSSYIKKYF